MATLVPGGGASADRGGSTQDLIRDFLRRLAGASAVGLVVGGLVGGVGGRIAMRVLAITSDDRLKGVLTDDEEPVNRYTFGGTSGLVIFLALGGAALAFLYLLLRRWLPRSRRARALSYGALFWAVQGSDVFDSEGFDFTRLEPTWLGVAMFTLIFFGVGALIALGVERYVDGWSSRWFAHLPLLPLVLFFPIAVPIAIAGLLAFAIHRNPSAQRVWRSAPVTLIGATALVAIGLATGIPTAANVIRILV